tara:strand:+ start:3743 stop:5941 length:2199 start_codon:yes stop_codon:yes gene_type:complete
MATTRFIDIKIRSKSAERKVDKLDRGMVKLGKNTDKTTKSFGALSKVATAIGTALSVQQLVKYADAFSSIQNQIRQTTKTTEELTKRTADLLAIANRSRVEFQETANLYTQLNLSTENLNLSTGELLRLTETISKSFAVSGKSAAEASGAIRQLGQAFAAGVLRGDEFNSIAENAPEIMRALQRSLNLTQGELRALAATGGITAKVLVNALGSAAEVIDDKMSKATKTFAQSMQEANNNMTDFIGNSATVQNIVGGAGGALVSASENIEVIAKSAVVLASVFAARLIPSMVTYTSSVIANTQAQLLNGTVATRTANVYGVVSVAQARATVTSNALTVSSRALSASMAFLGGPLGAALIAAVALVTLADSIEDVGDKSTLSAVEVDEFTESIKGLTRATKTKLLGDINTEMATLRTQLISSSEKLAQFQGFADSPIKTTQVNRYKQEVIDLNNQLDLLSEKQGLIIGVPDLSGGTDRGNINDEQPTGAGGKPKDESARLQAIRDSFKTESQLLFEKFEADKLILDQEVIDKQERFNLSLELALQYSENLRAIEQEGADDRIEISKREAELKQLTRQNDINSAQSIASTGLRVLQKFGDQSFKTQKKFAIAESLVNISAGVAKALNNPYPANLAFAAQVALQGASLISTIKSSNPSGGGSAPSISGGGSSSGVASSPSNEVPQQNRVVDIRLNDDAILTGSAVKQLISSALGTDDDITLQITSNQAELTRTGVI